MKHLIQKYPVDPELLDKLMSRLHDELDHCYMQNHSLSLACVTMGSLMQQLLANLDDEFLELLTVEGMEYNMPKSRRLVSERLGAFSLNDLFAERESGFSKSEVLSMYYKTRQAIEGVPVIPGTLRVVMATPPHDSVIPMTDTKCDFRLVFMKELT